MSQTAQTITVSEGGLYNAAVTNTTGCTSTMAVKTVSSTVSSLPVVSWVSNPATATFGAKVTLQASGTFNPTSYTWAANNGATVSGSGASAAVQLPASGAEGLKVTVTVIAENECGKSVSLTHEITMNSACPTPVVTAQSSTAQNTTAGSAVTLSVSVTNAVQATYQWFSSPSGASISGATSASYLYTPSGAGTASFYCVVKNGCTGNPTGNSHVFAVTAAANPENIAAGNGTLSGRTCFDIAQTEGGDTCGTLSSRLSQQADFTKSNINTQIYTFTPQGSVSNVHFQYVEKSGYKGEIVSNFEPNGYTVKVTYQTTLSGPQGKAKGLSTANAAYVTIYAIFNDGTGAEKTVKLKAEIKDCMCCGAKVSDTEWRAFMCHNLGTDQSLDPFDYTNPDLYKTNYYQWGSKDPISLVPGTTVGWIAVRPAGMWSNPKNTTNDPCDPGYRVPTKAEWEAVIKYNTLTYKGVAGALKGGLQIGTSLFLPSEGNFFTADVITSPLKPSGNLFYSSTDVYSSTQYYFYSGGGNSAISPLPKGEQRYAFPVRCISEK
ncbi:hypothetical protein [Flavobacterium sp. UBA7680]|uniref:hypothetical protein n=1 Tax=Flavobacterium sp. UBA7680 TaxID=1946559 RepID=UPI0025B9D2D5|nr:hypothetical protein [Flavobacterium sp. UBA7680]